MVTADEGGIALFSKPQKKRKKNKTNSLGPSEPGGVPDAGPVRQFEKAAQQADTVQDNTVTQGAQTLETEQQPAEADRRSGVVSTSGRSAEDERPVTFRSLGVSEWLDRVCRSLGIIKPTEVQRGCIPAILAGKDVLGTAHTGSGKTAAFALPILQKLAANPFGVFALVLTPTRELAMQLADQFRALGAGMSLSEAVIIGGLDMQTQAKALAKRPHVVVATPGRLRDLLTADESLAEGFKRVRFFVLDEADRLLEQSFESELRIIAGVLPAQRQTLLFSATLTRSLAMLQASSLRDAHIFQAYEGLETAKTLREEYVFIPAKVRELYLAHLLETLEEHNIRSVMVFTATCRGCHLLSLLMQELHIPAAALHSHLTQGRRLASLEKFKSGQVPILVATDVASRGLDIPTVDLVINYELPQQPRDYVHRVGRTARAGRGGWALSLVTQYDVELIHHIEDLIGHQLAEFGMKESDVLKNITRVYAAKRAAQLRAAEDESKEGGKQQLVKHKLVRKKKRVESRQ